MAYWYHLSCPHSHPPPHPNHPCDLYPLLPIHILYSIHITQPLHYILIIVARRGLSPILPHTTPPYPSSLESSTATKSNPSKKKSEPMNNQVFNTSVRDKVFKSGPSKICGRQPLKAFTWSILEYIVPFVL